MPTINVENLIISLQSKLALNPTDSDIMNAAVALKKLNTSTINSVSEYAELPLANASNLGKLYYVQSDNQVYQVSYLNSSYFWKSLAQTFSSDLYSVGTNTYGLNGCSNCYTCSFGNCLMPYFPSKSLDSLCDVSSGGTNIFAIDFSGTAYAIGENSYGKLGVGGTCSCNFVPRKLLGTWKQILPGNAYTYAIDITGSAYSWGRSYHQSLGLGCGNGTCVTLPTKICGTSEFSYTCVAMTTENIGGMIIRDDGTLWGWGYNASFALGLGCCNNVCFSCPVQVFGGGTTWCSVVGTYYGFAALKTDGCLWGWGTNSFGQIADGTQIGRCSPVASPYNDGAWCTLNCAGGDTYTTAALKTDGTLWTWGYGAYGVLGNGSCTLNYACSPIQTAVAGTNWCTISMSQRNAVAIKTDGTLWSWGCNDYGQLATCTCPSTVSFCATPVSACPSGKTNWWKAWSGLYGTYALDRYTTCTI